MEEENDDRASGKDLPVLQKCYTEPNFETAKKMEGESFAGNRVEVPEENDEVKNQT